MLSVAQTEALQKRPPLPLVPFGQKSATVYRVCCSVHGCDVQPCQNKARALRRCDATALGQMLEEKPICAKIRRKTPLFFTQLLQEKFHYFRFGGQVR